MYGSLEKFLRLHVYKSGDPRKGYLDVQSFVIQGHSVEKDIVTLSAQVAKWRVEVVQEAQELHKKEQAAKHKVEPSKSLFGFMGFFSGGFSAVKAPVIILSSSSKNEKTDEKKELVSLHQ
jgi:hypothetical protein